jgi:hypothetical protein
MITLDALENDDLMMKFTKEDINYFGGGVSLSKETPLLMGRRKSNHVLLFRAFLLSRNRMV